MKAKPPMPAKLAKKDKEPRGLKESSRKEEALDRKQGVPVAYKCGGKVKK